MALTNATIEMCNAWEAYARNLDSVLRSYDKKLADHIAKSHGDLMSNKIGGKNNVFI